VDSPVTTSNQVSQVSDDRPRRSTRIKKHKPENVTGKRKAKGHGLGRHGVEEAVVAKSEQGQIEAIDKIHLIQGTVDALRRLSLAFEDACAMGS
jgi:hypothetical protein